MIYVLAAVVLLGWFAVCVIGLMVAMWLGEWLLGLFMEDTEK